MNQHIITALVANKSGVLTRISGLFARRCFNIDSLVVCATEQPQLSRMTIVATGDDADTQQIIRQLDKLVDVLKVSELAPEKSVLRELLLIKIRAEASKRPEIESTCNIYKAKTIDLSPESVVIELTGEKSKLDAFITLLVPYGIIELSRSGLSALGRGSDSIAKTPDFKD